jgi:branched-chain amino acid transport system permease protein
MGFFLETLLGGLMAGMLYSLVALGFVLIFKASGVFNFAQGAMVLFAALAMARFSEWLNASGVGNLWLVNLIAFALAALVMFAVAWLIERLVLRKLVNQEGTTLLMATLGITYFLEGLGQSIFGSDIYKIDIGMPKEPVMAFQNVFEGGILINQEDLIAALIAAVLVAALSVFFQKTSTGRALRAVADDHQAAQSIGIPLNRIWVIVWCVAGVVALVAGMIWGSKLGVQFSLATVALRALPVVILGGLTSVPGAIIGGLIIGVGEKLSEVYLGPYVGGGIEIWFAYVLALLFLLVRPQGLFGEKIIDRVKDVGRIQGGPNDGAMFAPKYVENKLKFFPFIKEAVAYGDGRDRVCVMLNIDFDAVGNWAERRNLPYAGYTDLAQKPEVYQLLLECVEKVNADLSADNMLAGSQISRFLVLHKELDADDGELTRTNKVRRGYIAEKYAVLVDALYQGRAQQYIETAVKFEDGRSGSVSATLTLSDAKVFAPVGRAA